MEFSNSNESMQDTWSENNLEKVVIDKLINDESSREINHKTKSIQINDSNVPKNILKNVTAVIAIPKFEQGSKKSMRNELKVTLKFWRVLLDSGSDGDLIFIDKEAKSKFLIKKKLNSQKWHTSAGDFSSS